MFVKFRYNDYYAKDLNHRSEFEFVQDSANNQLIYSNDVRLHVLHTDEAAPYIQIEKSARGNSKFILIVKVFRLESFLRRKNIRLEKP